MRDYFLRLADQVDDSGDRSSCFLVNSALELARHDREVRDRINRHFDAIEGRLRDALERALQAGELPPGRNPSRLAGLLMTNIWGLRVLASTGPTGGRARAVVEQLLETLD